MFVRPTRLACGIHRAALTLSLASSLLVIPAAWAQAQRYNIPDSSLAEALSRFAADSGVMITFSAEDTSGLSSPGLQGNFELDQGFARCFRVAVYAWYRPGTNVTYYPELKAAVQWS